MSAATRFREAKASPLRAPKSASRAIFSESRRAARRKPDYALAASRKNWRRYDEVRQDRQSLQTDPVGYEDDLNLYQYVSNDPLNRADPTGRQEEARTPYPVGWLSNPFGATVRLLGQVGDAIEDTMNAPSQSEGVAPTLPPVPGTHADGSPIYAGTGPGGRPGFRGEPGSWESGPRQDRKYGPDGYPETDVDYSNDGGLHGEERPHSQDWGRPSDGSPPTAEDRGDPRPTSPGERFSEGSRDPNGYLPPDRRPPEKNP